MTKDQVTNACICGEELMPRVIGHERVARPTSLQYTNGNLEGMFRPFDDSTMGAAFRMTKVIYVQKDFVALQIMCVERGRVSHEPQMLCTRGGKN
jgi:hypothetical protein